MQNYKDEIVHFRGGINEYIGELLQEDHPSGPGWYRILNPCSVIQVKKGNETGMGIARIWGMDKLYQKHVDIYCPSDSLMEIRVLDKEGSLYKSYQQELERPERSLIVTPGEADIRMIKSQKNRDKRKRKMR